MTESNSAKGDELLRAIGIVSLVATDLVIIMTGNFEPAERIIWASVGGILLLATGGKVQDIKSLIKGDQK